MKAWHGHGDGNGNGIIGRLAKSSCYFKEKALFTDYVVRFRDLGFCFTCFHFWLFWRTRKASHWNIVIVVFSPGIWELDLSLSASDIPFILFRQYQ
jgi:hypothetical protein